MQLIKLRKSLSSVVRGQFKKMQRASQGLEKENIELPLNEKKIISKFRNIHMGIKEIKR